MAAGVRGLDIVASLVREKEIFGSLIRLIIYTQASQISSKVLTLTKILQVCSIVYFSFHLQIQVPQKSGLLGFLHGNSSWQS